MGQLKKVGSGLFHSLVSDFHSKSKSTVNWSRTTAIEKIYNYTELKTALIWLLTILFAIFEGIKI